MPGVSSAGNLVRTLLPVASSRDAAARTDAKPQASPGGDNELLAILDDFATPATAAEGMQYFFACLPMALGGLFSAIALGRVAAGSINILAKKPDDWSKGLILCGIVEFYAILSLLASMLMLLFM